MNSEENTQNEVFLLEKRGKRTQTDPASGRLGDWRTRAQTTRSPWPLQRDTFADRHIKEFQTICSASSLGKPVETSQIQPASKNALRIKQRSGCRETPDWNSTSIFGLRAILDVWNLFKGCAFAVCLFICFQATNSFLSKGSGSTLQERDNDIGP